MARLACRKIGKPQKWPKMGHLMHCITSLSLDLRDRNRIWAQRTHYNESSFCESCKKKLAWKNNVHFFVQNWGGITEFYCLFCSDFAFCATNYPQKSGICCFLDTDLARNCPKKKFGRGCRSTRRWCDIGWMCTTPPMLLLRKSVPPASTAFGSSGRWTLREDTDPKHRSRLAERWRKDNGVAWMSWPTQSPDLNPTEKMLKTRKPKTKQGLVRCIKRKWARLLIEYAKHLIDSMPKRIEAVISVKGDNTHYWPCT